MNSSGQDPNAFTETPNHGFRRWVKWFLIITALLVVIAVISMLLIGGDHGPGMHRSMGSVSELTDM